MSRKSDDGVLYVRLGALTQTAAKFAARQALSGYWYRFLLFIRVFLLYLALDVLGMLRLYRGVIGQYRLDIELFDASVNVVLGNFYHHRQTRQYADKVRYHHQTVERIGDIPREGACHNSARDHHQHEEYLVALCRFQTEQVLERLRTVMRPADHRREREQKYRDRYENAARRSENVAEAVRYERRVVGSLGSQARFKVDLAGGEHYDRRHSADYHGIREYLENAPHTLLYGLADVGRGVYHYRRAETRLVGEYAALATLRYNRLYAYSDRRAADCLNAERELEYAREDRADLRNVREEYYKTAKHVQARHKRHYLLRERRDALQTAENDQTAEYHQQHTDDNVCPLDVAERVAEVDVLEYRAVEIDDDLVDLTHIADTEAGKNREHREQPRKEAPYVLAALIAAQSVAQIVHRAAAPLALRVFAAVVDTEDILGEVRHHAEERRDPHPEYRAGSADDDSRSHARDIARADSRRKRRTERLELRYRAFLLIVAGFALLAEHTADSSHPPFLYVGDLEKFGRARQQNARADQQNQAEISPHEGVYRVVYFGKTL